MEIHALTVTIVTFNKNHQRTGLRFVIVNGDMVMISRPRAFEPPTAVSKSARER
jgi:hypothetical protein